MPFFVYAGRHAEVGIECNRAEFRATPTGFRAMSSPRHRAARRSHEGEDSRRVTCRKMTTAIEVHDDDGLTLAAFRGWQSIRGGGFVELPEAPKTPRVRP